jgi:hypothetical protein
MNPAFLEEIRQRLPGLLPSWIERHLQRMPAAYAQCGPAEIAGHVQLLRGLRPDGRVSARVAAQFRPAADGYEVVVVGESNTGTLMCITTALALQEYFLEDVRLFSPGLNALREALPDDPPYFVAICRIKPLEEPPDPERAAGRLVWHLSRAFQELKHGHVHYAQHIVRELSGTDPPDVKELPPDRRQLGRFRVTRWHARGGMSNIYLGTQLGTGRPVAIKVARPAQEDDRQWCERFGRELAAHIGYDCPHVVKVIDGAVEEDEGGAFAWLAMEFLPDDLRRRLQEEGPPLRELGLRWLEEALQGLRYVHGQGAVHCDLKPANLLLTDSNHLKIGDFGVLRRPQIDPADVRGGFTRLYAAPEQIAGDRPDPRWDIYALGMTFLEIFTTEPDRARLPLLPAALQVVLGRMVEEEPWKRYQNAAVILEDLRSYRGER